MSTETIGQRLREARESIPASLYQASRETKIRVDFLESMEDGNFKFVSGGPYVKGMLRAYGRWLRLDEGELSQDFTRLQEELPEASVTEMVREPTRVPPRKRPRWVLAGVFALLVLLVASLAGVMNPVGDVAKPPSLPKETQAKDDQMQPETEAASPGVSPPSAAAPAPPGTAVQLAVVTTGPSWIEAVGEGADGALVPLFKGVLPAGSNRIFEAAQRVRMVIGNMGGVRITLNGRDLGIPGKAGQVGKFVFDPNTASFLPG